MHNDILVSVIGFLLCLWLTLKAYDGFKKVFDNFSYLNKENKFINEWKKIRVKVLKKGFNLDYVYDYSEFETLRSFVGDMKEKEFLDNQEQANYYNLICNGPMIYYGYIFEGQKYFSREIGLFPAERDIDLFYSLKVGDVIEGLVNPENPAESYLRKTSDEEISEYEWESCKKLFPQLSLTIFMWFLFIYGIYDNFVA